VIILGKHSDDKGTQLEKLTKTLLESKGYRNVCRSWIGSGGDEIDVQGEFSAPLLNSTKTHRLICECKAYKDAVSLPEWLKFCGKLYVAGYSSTADQHGCFIALSGVNGNVRGSHDALKEKGANIELVTGDDLQSLVQSVYPHHERKNILDAVKRVSSRTVTGSDLAYCDGRVYWLVMLEDESYTILQSNGQTLSGGDATLLCPMVERSQPVTKYVNLQEEAMARTIAFAAESWVIGRLMVAGGNGSRFATTAAEGDLTKDDLNAAGERLMASGVITATDADNWTLPDSDFGKIVTLYRTLFAGSCSTSHLGCHWYDAHIDRSLLEEIRKIQAGMAIDDEASERVLQVLRISPTALRLALQPIEIIVNGREQCGGKFVPEIVAKGHQDHFMNVLFQAVHSDFEQPALANYFFQKREIKEVELRASYILKSDNGVRLQHDYRQRNCHGELSAGNAAVMIALDSQPEPGEQSRTCSEDGR
jgi:Restriction endonuclease